MAGQNGRAVLPLATHTFSNGRTVQIRPVSQFTLAHIEIAARKAKAPPPIPVHHVEIGGQTVEEPNDADPEYQEALARYNGEINFKVMDGTIELGVEVEVDQDELARITRVMDMLGTPLNEVSEKVAYVKHVCMTDVGRDASALVAAIQALSGPTPEAVEAHVAMFPGDDARA